MLSLRRALFLLLVLLSLVSAAPVRAVEAQTRQWPHFLQIHVEQRRADTRVIIDNFYAGTRWVSQPGVVPGDYLVRIDQDGFARSLDDKLALFRQPSPGGQGLKITIQSPGVDGADTYSWNTGTQPMSKTGESRNGLPGNTVADVWPYQPRFSLPMDFEIHVAGRCRANQYLQVAPEWTGTVWRTPDGIGPGTYRLRVNPDFSVTSLDGLTSFSQIPAKEEDRRIAAQILGVLIVHSCDPQGDGADIVGFDRGADGTFAHQTTWAQQPDTGYGWQIFNTATTFARPDGFYGGNYIVQTRYETKPPLDFAPTRLTGSSLPGVSAAATRAQWSNGSAPAAVLARWDVFADGLAGVPLAVAKGAPLLLTSTNGLDTVVAEELRRIVRNGGTVYLLGGTAALGSAVESGVRSAGFTPKRLQGPTRIETAIAIANEIGPASIALIVNASNFPDALTASSASGVVGRSHILLTNATSVPGPTAARLGGYQHRIVFGGSAVVTDATYNAVSGTERIAGPHRDITAAVAARRFFPSASAVWVADGTDFAGGISGGAMAAASRRGPLTLASGGLSNELRAYLAEKKPAAGYVMANLPDSVVRMIFTQSAR